MEKEIILKSINPAEYPDEIVKCRIIENADINSYLETIPKEQKFSGTKTANVIAQKGIVGQIISTKLYTERNGKVYLLSEEENVVGQRDIGGGEISPDIVVTSINGSSNESYVVKATKFPNMYIQNPDGTFSPKAEVREFARIDEDLIIKTAWGSEAVCLAGSYIVTYNASENDFNTIEKSALASTYSYGPLLKMSL